jgi:hypothetical protein
MLSGVQSESIAPRCSVQLQGNVGARHLRDREQPSPGSPAHAQQGCQYERRLLHLHASNHAARARIFARRGRPSRRTIPAPLGATRPDDVLILWLAAPPPWAAGWQVAAGSCYRTVADVGPGLRSGFHRGPGSAELTHCYSSLASRQESRPKRFRQPDIRRVLLECHLCSSRDAPPIGEPPPSVGPCRNRDPRLLSME